MALSSRVRRRRLAAFWAMRLWCLLQSLVASAQTLIISEGIYRETVSPSLRSNRISFLGVSLTSHEHGNNLPELASFWRSFEEFVSPGY